MAWLERGSVGCTRVWSEVTNVAQITHFFFWGCRKVWSEVISAWQGVISNQILNIVWLEVARVWHRNLGNGHYSADISFFKTNKYPILEKKLKHFNMRLL